jgi:Fur family ferric uptake transcriptional regulator
MKHSASHQDNHAIAQQRLQALGERRTPARQTILTLLLDANNALSHQDIHELLKARNEPFDRVTLYRVLDWLVAKKLAHKLAGEDRIWRFNAASDEQHVHPHFHCIQCGKVSCMATVHVNITPLPKGYRSINADTTIQGACPDCAG